MGNQLFFSAPPLRFEEFKDEWKEASLGDLVENFEYGLNASSKEYDGKNKYLRITDINEVTRKFSTNNLTSPNVNLSLSSNYILEERDVLFARTGASVGKTYIYEKTDGIVYFAGFLIRARIKKDHNPQFVFQNTLTSNYNNFVKVTSQRSGQPGINAQEYSNYRFKIPGFNEQEKIGLFFKKIDDTISLHQQELEALKQTKQGFLQKMFPNNGESVPEIRFPGFDDTWLTKELIDIVTEISTGKSKFIKGNSEGDYTILGSTGIIGCDDSYDYEGDFLLTARVGVNAGQLYEYSGKVKITDNTVFIKGDNLSFIHPLLEFFDLKKLSFGSGQPLIKSSELKKLKVRVPSLKEQLKIGEFFRQLDEVIELKEKEIEALKETKKGFLQKMFV